MTQPLQVSFESKDGVDHVIFVFRKGGRWGAVARSRDAGLHGRQLVDLRALGKYGERHSRGPVVEIYRNRQGWM